MASAAVPAFSQALWTVTPFLSPGELSALSFASPTLGTTLRPASQRAARADELAQELKKLPFGYTFPLQPLGLDVLEGVLQALRPVRPLRRRELVGQGAGWAPTEEDTWCFQSRAELETAVAAARVAVSSAQRGCRPVLLLGTVLRRAAEQAVGGPLATASVGLEWLDGPAADPLQLGLRLALSEDGGAKVDLELGSGAWSPWAETWTLHDRTLEARIAVAAVLPAGGRALIVQDFRGPSQDSADAGAQEEGCVAEGAEALAAALTEAGAAGVRAVICIGGLCWGKEAPPWCPPEVRRVVTHSRR